jgi:hypothetical protein
MGQSFFTFLAKDLHLMESVRIVGAGAIFIDDIVLPDGTTHMGILGGGTLHAMMGAALWDERPGISAFVGEGLPEAVMPFLERHLDTNGIVKLPIPQVRAWQIFEHDGTRRELHRVKDVAPFTGGTMPDHLPDSYRQADGYYLLQGFEGIHKWQDVSGIKFWEPSQLVMLPDNRELMRDVLQTCPLDAVSPNLAEAQAIYGMHPPETLIRMMFEDGAKRVILRMGREGSLIAERDTDAHHHVPAVDVPHVVDETGAGNTYNGAFLAGWIQGRNLRECAVMGTVAASFCVEQVGVLNPSMVNHAERDARYHALLC